MREAKKVRQELIAWAAERDIDVGSLVCGLSAASLATNPHSSIRASLREDIDKLKWDLGR